MRQLIAAAALSCLLGLANCSDVPATQQAQINQALTVACNVDGTVVPIAQPLVANAGAGGGAAATLDALLVHPAVVAACQQVNGTPIGAVAAAPVVQPKT